MRCWFDGEAASSPLWANMFFKDLQRVFCKTTNSELSNSDSLQLVLCFLWQMNQSHRGGERVFNHMWTKTYTKRLHRGRHRIICLHLTLSLTSFVTPTLYMSFFPTSMNLLWGLPLFLLAGSSIFNIFSPVYPLSSAQVHNILTSLL